MLKRVVDRFGSVRRLGSELWRGGRGPILAGVAGGWFLSLGVRMIYPAILPQLRAAYDLDLTTAGLLITTLWVAYALGQLPGGVLDDRLDGGKVLVASTGISALALAFVVTSRSIGPLFGATLLFGFATALYGVARFTILSNRYPDHGGTAIGLTMAAGDLGNTLLPPLAGFLAVAFAWQAGLGFGIPLFLVATAVLWIVLPSGSADSDATTEASADSDATAEASAEDFLATLRKVADALHSRSVVVVVAIQTLGYCIWQAFTAFYPTYLIESKGLAPATATILFGGFFAMGIFVKPAAGSAYDRYGLRRSLPVVLIAIMVAMALLPLVEGLFAIVIVTALASGVLGYGTITLTYLTNSLPDDVQGTGLGTLRTGYMVVGAGSPTVVGALADAGYFDEAFFLLGAIAAATVLLCWFVPTRELTVRNRG